jgi:homogentisate 1,2-dioxygenase
VYKLSGKFFVSKQEHSPFDVVAWHGNYVPYKYDLTKFVNVGSISVDHIDPSIFCVMTAPSRDPAAPLADFLIFSPRWDVASHSRFKSSTGLRYDADNSQLTDHHTTTATELQNSWA